MNARQALRVALAASSIALWCVWRAPVRAAENETAAVVPVARAGTWTPAAIARLRRDIDALLADAPALRGAHVGLYAVDTASGDVLYERGANSLFQGASTTKLVVGSAALDTLGPLFRFRTDAFTFVPRPVPGGADPAPVLVLRGGGDPFLSARDLDDFAATVAARVPTIAALALDVSRYDDRPYPDGWTWDDFAFDYAARVSPLTVEENVLHLEATAGPAPGEPAAIDSRPLPFARFACASELHEGAARARTLPAGAETTFDVQPRVSGCIRTSGGVAVGRTHAVDAAVPSPVRYAYEVALAALRAAGVRVGPSSAASPVPATAATAGPSLPEASASPAPLSGATLLPAEPLPDLATTQTPRGGEPQRLEVDAVSAQTALREVWRHDSPPLAEVLGKRFWIPSDNLVAETLLKELGYHAGAKPGSTAAGIAVEMKWLRSLGIDPAGLTLADGCGMSQYDRITPRDLVVILQHDWSAHHDLVLASLPIGGVRGTIEGIAGTPAAGRTFAKTGSMMHVRGLAGYLAPREHGAVTFAFQVDDWNGDYGELAAVRAKVLSRIVGD